MPIMIMNPDEYTFDVLVQYNLEPELFSITILHAFEHYLKSKLFSNTRSTSSWKRV
jgi:alanine racemase